MIIRAEKYGLKSHKEILFVIISSCFIENIDMRYFILITIFILAAVIIHPQEPDFKSEFNSGNYQNSVKIIEKKLDDIYNKRSDKKKVPTGFITLRSTEKEENLIEVFRKRRAEHFFIEDNFEIFELHLFAARSYFQLLKYDYSLNHHIQAMRFKKVEPGKDDEIAYEIAQIYKKTGNLKAYTAMLETAYSLNSIKLKYSLELGAALYTTVEKKKSVYHLERYVTSTTDDYDPKILVMIANLNEDLGRYLETEKYYIEYLKKKSDDPYINFALGYTAFARTGNFILGEMCLKKALTLLPESDIFRRSKAHEIIADMAYKNLKIEDAVLNYLRTIEYQKKTGLNIEAKKNEITKLKQNINQKKSLLLREQNFDEFEEYEILRDEAGRKELELKEIEKEYSKLNAGKVRWNLAECYVRLEKSEEAIKYYRECISFNYKSNDSREMIIKLQLKIKRGY